MSILFVLIAVGLALLALAAWAFIWAVDHDQFEDLEQAAHSILLDADEVTREARGRAEEGSA
ncbi:MAG TPA: cbb3-type cytochrome oxidase assembly protein CcoS [Myxococcota bacterium]|nr:cbb3-type cytochrome oxidase assembly protein CcoS [Myxococcota bacterium]